MKRRQEDSLTYKGLFSVSPVLGSVLCFGRRPGASELPPQRSILAAGRRVSIVLPRRFAGTIDAPAFFASKDHVPRKPERKCVSFGVGLGYGHSSPRARPPDYDESSARRDHQASAAVIALSAWWMPSPTSPAVAAQCKGIRARAPGSHRCSSGVSGSGAVPS